MRAGINSVRRWCALPCHACRCCVSRVQAANYGMPSPHGYRTAARLFALAERSAKPRLPAR
jgi:hypothetical protein